MTRNKHKLKQVKKDKKWHKINNQVTITTTKQNHTQTTNRQVKEQTRHRKMQKMKQPIKASISLDIQNGYMSR